MSEETIAIVKSSWAGWRQGLHAQWVRDLAPGLAERVEEWEERTGHPDLEPEEFIDEDGAVLVRARARDSDQRRYWFRYTLDGLQITRWDVYEDEAAARSRAAG